MPAADRHIPKYRHYRPKDLAVVRIGGHDHYLGKFGSPESYEKYHRLLAERHARGPAPPPNTQGAEAGSESLTISELVLGYYRHCEQYYVKNGRATNQVRMIRLALKTLNRLYGSTLIGDFGPLKLEACQAEFVRQGLSRRECNRRTILIKQAFRWATAKELAPRELYYGLLAVTGLKSGRCGAHDPPPVGPVPAAIVERTMEYLSPTVAAMVRLQLATAMRPGELVIMRACDLNMSGPVWEYWPSSHKGEHHETRAAKVVMIGPKAQEIIRPLLCLDISGYMFSPRRVVTEQTAKRHAERKSPLWSSHINHQAKKRSARGRRPLNDCYDVNSYRRAIARACDKAFPHPTLSPIGIRDLSGPQLDELKELQKALRSKDLSEERRKEIKASIGILLRRDLSPDQRAELKAWQKSHRWHPHQLRHTAATLIRKQYGAEAAQAVLGHAELNTTEIYAQRSLEAARQIMREIG